MIMDGWVGHGIGRATNNTDWLEEDWYGWDYSTDQDTQRSTAR